jgi:hypothetical protein
MPVNMTDSAETDGRRTTLPMVVAKTFNAALP